jgi:thiamine monophosphate synthase
MSKSNLTETEQGIGSEVAHFVYRAPKKNHDAMEQLPKHFAEIMRRYGALLLIFQLNSNEQLTLQIRKLDIHALSQAYEEI